jgi:hypothetical protein
MDRITALESSVTSSAVPSTQPRRRWSDGPQYPWSPATDDAWSVATHWPALVAVLCEQVADGTNGLATEIERLCTHGLLSQEQAKTMRRDVQGMRASGLALQQILRLGAGVYNLSPDRLDLSDIARAAVRERQRDVIARGGDLGMDLRRAEVWVDGSVAAGLLQAGLDWALSFSNHVRVKVEPGDGTEPARLVIRGALSRSRARQPATGNRRNRRMNDNLHWVLLRQLASCAHLPISRSSTAATEAAIVEFPAYITVGPRGLP